MKFYVTKDVFEKMPRANFALLSVKGMDNSLEKNFISNKLTEAIEVCKNYFEGKIVKSEEELAPYREAFQSMGINPNKFMSSIEALLTRVSKGKGLPHINPIVDLGNSVSLKYYVPIGAHDLDTMEDEKFCVRIATAEDIFLPFGEKEGENVDIGEIVYATGNRVRTRRWIWRQGEDGKIIPTTSDFLYIVDGFEENIENTKAARDELADIISAMGYEVKKGLINKDKMEFETL